jgi:hypothetical protein
MVFHGFDRNYMENKWNSMVIHGTLSHAAMTFHGIERNSTENPQNSMVFHGHLDVQPWYSVGMKGIPWRIYGIPW